MRVQELSVKKYIEHFSANRCTLVAGAFSLFCCVPVGLIVIAVAGFLVVKGKFAYFVIHGAVPIKDEGRISYAKDLQISDLQGASAPFSVQS